MNVGLTKIIHGLEGFQKIAEKISSWDPIQMINSFFVPSKPMRCGFQVLNHGDDWLNNMMFKREEGKTVDVKFLDFQISYWGSPVGDLFYLLVSSVQDDIKVKHFDDFIELYHDELEASLKKLNYDQHIPTLSELHIDLIEKRQFGASCMTDIMSIVKYDSDHELTMEQFMDPSSFDDDMIKRIFGNENYLKALKIWLKFMYKRGILDPVEKEIVK